MIISPKFTHRFLVISAMLCCVAGCATAPSHKFSALDDPISFRGQKEGDAIATTIKALSPADAGAFQMANEIVRQKFEARRALPLTEAQRARAYETTLEGMTPRQVILLGMMLHADRLSFGVEKTELGRAERLPREDHIQEHDDGNDTIVMDAIRRYSPHVGAAP